MLRALLVLLVLAALLGGAAWRVTAERRSRVADDAEGIAVSPAPIAEVPSTASREVDEAPPLSQRVAVAPPLRASAVDVRAFTGRITGRVVFPPGTPSDEEVWVVTETARARVAADGEFSLVLQPKTHSARLRLEARYLYLSDKPVWHRNRGDEPFVLEPVLGARIVGTLRAPDGVTSVAGKLRAVPPLGKGNAVELSIAHERTASVRTPADAPSLLPPLRKVPEPAELSPAGELPFAFDALPAGSYLLDFDGPPWIGCAPDIALEPGETATVELVLRRGATIAGFVRDQHGAPFEDVTVSATVVDCDHRLPASSRVTRSERDGSFALDAVFPGAVQIHAVFDRYRRPDPATRPMAEGETLTGIVLVVERGPTISGVVRWPDGTPAVAVVSASDAQWNSRTAWCDADGRFQIVALDEGEYSLRASAQRDDETFCVERAPVPAGASGVELVLSRGLVLAGTVTDDRGAALPSFSVRATSEQRVGERTITRSYTNAVGKFELGGFGMGPWLVQASSQGHADSEPVRVEMPSGPVRLVVPREAIVRGVVLDASGAPVERARVVARRERGGASEDLLSDRSDRDGEFRIGRLPPETIMLVVKDAQGYPIASTRVACVANATTDGVVLRLEPSETVTAPR